MAAPDVSNIEKMVTALTEKRLAFLRRSPELDGLSHAQASRATARQASGSALREAGVDIERFDRRLAGQRTDWRQVFQSEDAELAKTADSDRRAFKCAVEDRRKAFDELAVVVGRPGFITLSKPFLIFANRTLVDSQI